MSKVRYLLLRSLMGLGVASCLLLLLEVVLRLSGVGFDPSFTKQCEVAGTESICENPAFSWQFFPRAIARTVPSFAFSAAKPERTVRIFVLGGSAAQGDPEPSFSFARILEVLLEERHPDLDFEIINTAITAVNSHVVLPIARDIAADEGDLFIIYMGNNEVVGPFGPSNAFSRLSSSLTFIRAQIMARRTRLGQVMASRLGANRGPGEWRGMAMFMDQKVPWQDPRLAATYAHFEANLRDILSIAHAAGAKTVVSTVGTNWRSCGPFFSLNASELEGPRLAAWEESYRAGVESLGAGDTASARQFLERAEAIDASHADLQFQLANLNWAEGNFPAAQAGYLRAQDLDVLRFRADSALNGILRRVGKSLPAAEGVFVDAAAEIARLSPHGIPGTEMFVDHVHLSFAGNYAVAVAMLPAVEQQLPGASNRAEEGGAVLAASVCADRLAYSGFDRLRLARDMATRLARAPFTNESDHRDQLAAAESHILELADFGLPEGWAQAATMYREAIAIRPDDVRLRYNHGVLLAAMGDHPAAAAEFTVVLQSLPQDVMAREKLSAALVGAGRYADGIVECRQLIRMWPEFEVPYYTLAYALAREGRFDESLVVYDQLLKVDAEATADIQNEIGLIENTRGRPEAAIAAFRLAIAAVGRKEKTEASDLYYNLGQVLRRAGRRNEATIALARAKGLYLKALETNSDSVGSLLMLGRIAVDSHELSPAAGYFRQVLERDSSNIEAYLGLVRVQMDLGLKAEALATARIGVQELKAVGKLSQAAPLRQFLAVTAP